MKEFYAKSSPKITLEKHTSEALHQYDLLKILYPEILTEEKWKMLRCAVLYHDLGKLDENFQKKINNTNYKTDEYIYHNFLSGALVDRKRLEADYGKDNAWIILTAITFHHDREYQENLRKTVKEYAAKYLWDNAADYHFEGYVRPEKLSANYLKSLDIDNSCISPDYLKIKGFLNKIDYCASSNIDIEQSPLHNGKNISQLTLKFFSRNNMQINKLQQYMLEHREENVVVKASTGSGKTEGALLWLDSAKSFYTLPLKVSINAIFQRITNQNGIAYKPALLLHSDALSYYINIMDKDDILDEANIRYSMAKKLSAPMTVCTIDQILKFAYKYNGAEMSLAALSHSKLIIDEIQSYSPDLIGTIIYSLKVITKLGGKFAIITATFPKIIKTLLDNYEIKVAYSPNFYGKFQQRHKMTLLKENKFDLGKIVSDSKSKKVLIIVNTVSHAQELYSELKDVSDCRLLHSMFIKKHRDRLEKDILDFAPNSDTKNDKRGIWISTQIVEASLDIDFDVLYTEMCTIDSLLQRMGRVYRNRNYTGENPNVYILDNKNGVNGGFIDPEIYDLSVKAIDLILSNQPSVILEEREGFDMKTQMIDYVYDNLGEDSNYYRTIQTRIDYLKNLGWYTLNKKEVDSNFRDIDSITICPHEIYTELSDTGKVREWKKAISDKKLSPQEKQKIKDEIKKHTVSISYYQGLDIDRNSQLFYTHSGIYLYNGSYDFNEKSCTGCGIIKQYRNKPHYEVKDLII